MKKYQCHKVVEAARILKIEGRGAPFDAHLDNGDIEEINYRTQSMAAEDVLAGNPLGYFVRYDDGYESYSPAAVFEAGYHEIPA